MTIPIAPVAGLMAGVASAIPWIKAGNWESAMHEIVRNFTGYYIPVREFRPQDLQRGLMPLVAGLLVHKFVGGAPLNLNKTLAAAGVPFLRI